jgi:hypothetical protein
MDDSYFVFYVTMFYQRQWLFGVEYDVKMKS